MEKEYQISWLKIVGITILIAVVIIIICLLYPKKNHTYLTQQTYINNIGIMKEAGFEYFSGNNLPKEIGDTKRISLDEMIARNLLVEFLDEDGNSCNKNNSYVEATKTLENEYEMGVYLTCNNKSDYIITSITDYCPDCTIDTKDDNTSTNIPTNPSSNNSISRDVTSKKTSNSNNSNSSNNPVNIVKNTNVNINYVNSCCSYGSNNCTINCLSNVYHSVIFDSNGGTSVRTQTVKHGGYAIYKSTSRFGYDFLGWYLNGEKFDFNTPITEKMVLEAKWQKKDLQNDYKEVYVINFDSNGGSKVPSQKVVEKSKVVRPSNPTKDCYDFGGWYQDVNLTKKYDFNTKVTKDITLYAKWIDNGTCKDTYRVKFDSNGGSAVATQMVEEGNYSKEPKDPTRNGYVFLGWYLNGYKFNFNTRIYEDITLEARWEKEEVKYNTYCKIKNDTYYSISYVSANQNTWDYSWTVHFYNLNYVKNLRVTKLGYLTTLSMYNKAYNVSYDKGISMVGSTGLYNVPITSGAMLRSYSLKANNFTMTVGTPYKNSGDWYAKLSVKVKNYNNLTSYYASNINSRIYFVPFYFEVEYTDLNQCINDKASNSYKYDDYEIVDSYYR